MRALLNGKESNACGMTIGVIYVPYFNPNCTFALLAAPHGMTMPTSGRRDNHVSLQPIEYSINSYSEEQITDVRGLLSTSFCHVLSLWA